MVDLALLAMVIASAVSLIVVSPRKTGQEALRALKEYDEANFVPTSVSEWTADARDGLSVQLTTPHANF
jgi:hypothetical protein